MPEVVIAALITTGGVFVAQEQQRKAASKAAAKQKKAAEQMQKKQAEQQQKLLADQIAYETQAGEHWGTLSRDQMVLQAQGHQMNTLLELITAEEKSSPATTQILTLPAARAEPSALDRLNQAIDDMLGGAG